MPSETESFLGVQSGGGESKPSGSRYPALIIIISIYRILAVVTGIAAIVLIGIGINKLNGYGDTSEAYTLILWGIFGGFFGVVSCLATAEIIRVFLDIEENTRNTGTPKN